MFLGTFFTITNDNITAMLGYVADFIEDFTPLLLPILAVGLGILIIWAIVSAIKG